MKMSLKKLIVTAGLALSLSGPLLAQNNNMISINPIPSERLFESIERLSELETAPLYTYNLIAHRIKNNGKERGARPAGTIEIRENSVYAELLLGIYKILFIQDNDSTFSTYQSTKLLWYSQLDKYVETVTDSVRVQSVFTTKENSEQKMALIDLAYSKEYQPLVTIIKQFLHNQNDTVAKTISLGKPHHLPLYDRRIEKGRILTQADVGSLVNIKDGDNLEVNLENPMYFYSTLHHGMKIPYLAEGKATINNAPILFSFLNGHWKIVCALEENK